MDVLLEGDVVQRRNVAAFGVLEKNPEVIVVKGPSLLRGEHFREAESVRTARKKLERMVTVE